ncbi:MAG: DUF4190 domain-containing protein [Bacteroidota bacterium]
MKKIRIPLITLLINVLLMGGTAYASFPVQKDKSNKQMIASEGNVQMQIPNEKLNSKEEASFPQEPKAVKSGDMDGMAVAGFVCALVGFFIAGVILGILGIVFSIIALNRMGTSGKKGRGLAIAGFILGIIDVVGALIIISRL